jgi:putative transposase
MNELFYPSDLTAAQWALIEPLPAEKPRGRRRKVDLRSITNAIFMYSRAASPGACCREISLHRRPCTITFVFGGSPDCETGFTINFGMKYESNAAGMPVRVQPWGIARAWPPSKRGDRGYDAGKHTKGRKQHIVVDVLGLILAVAVTGANVQDRDGGQLVLSGLKNRFARMARVWADGAYAGQLVGWAQKTARFVLDIVASQRDRSASPFCHGVGL